MNDYDDEAELANYLWFYFGQFFTPVEQRAYKIAFIAAKVAGGFEHIRDEHIRECSSRKGYPFAEDPLVMQALADGVEVFRRRAALRVLRHHGYELSVNRCRRCNRIVRTPKAQQCFWCGLDWHDVLPDHIGG